MEKKKGENPGDGAMLSGREKLWTRDFALITLINLALFCGFQMFPAALPPYVKSLGASNGVLGWLTGISTIATILSRPVAGVILDRFGRRGIFLSGIVFLALTSMAHYFFPVVAVILVIRFLHGLGWGVATTASNTIAADYIPKSRFGEGMGFFSLAAGIAIAVSPAVALSLGAGPMIWSASIFTLLALAMALFLPYRAVRGDAFPAEARSRLPYEKSAVPPAVIMFAVTVTYGALITFLALYGEQRGISNVGPFFTVFAAVMLLTRPFIGRLIDRRGREIVILPGVILISAALLLLSRSASPGGFLLCAALYGLGQSCIQVSTQTMAVLAAPRHRIGAANATFFTGFDAGIGCGAVLAGFLSSRAGYSPMFASLAVFPLLAGLLFLVIRKRFVPRKA